MINVLKYWHAEEFLLPQTLDDPTKLNNEYQKSFDGDLDTIIEEVEHLKKENERKTSSDDFIWEFTIYGLLYEVKSIKEKLLSALKVPDDFEERIPYGKAASYALSFNSEFQFKENGVQISTVPWAIKSIFENKDVKHLDYDKFQSLEQEVKESLNEDATADTYNSRDFLNKANELFQEKLGNDLVSYACFQVIAINKMRKNITEASSTDLLNSFHIEDLHSTVEYLDNRKNNKLLNQYLKMAETRKRERIDIRENIEHVYNMLSPDKLPDACWPADGGYPLVYSQQFAINAINERLSNDSGLYAVNGPPGTGKTTMLRDLIAHVITNRAKEIAKLDTPQGLFEHTKSQHAWKNGDNQQWYRKLKDVFLGHEIVVASSNNGAVENITMEIPSEKSIDKKWLSEIDFFSDIGSGLIGEKAWGSGAACLGNSSNKKKFRDNFWSNREKKNNEFDGFFVYLTKVSKGNKDSLDGAWEKAKKEFLDAVQAVEKHKKEKMKVKNHPVYIASQMNKIGSQYKKKMDDEVVIEREKQAAKKNIDKRNQDINECRDKIRELDVKLTNKKDEYKRYEDKVNSLKNEINEWYIRKPSVFDIIFTLGKSWRKWEIKRDGLERKESKIEVDISSINKEINALQGELGKKNEVLENLTESKKELKNKIMYFQQKLENIKKEIEMLKQQYLNKKREYESAIKLLHQYEARNDNEDDREKSSPWTQDTDFQAARTKVFIKALNLHKALIDANAKKIRMNLQRLMEVLGNKVKKGTEHEDVIRHLWASLFFCVPVVSTTFASFGRLFSQLWDNKIGWLLIDEAGQASAKAAVGAIMRSQRAVVVGDPLQLEPIIGLPGSVQEILHKTFTAHEKAFSEHTSVQKRADATEIHGTYLESHKGESIWVGSPLRVHRRCDSPMFEISNQTTYKGLMIQGKEKGDCTLEQSSWFNIDSTATDGHWIKGEGQEALTLVQRLLNQGVGKDDIYLISPFRDVVKGLKGIFNQKKLIDESKRIGTIHTVQGKEAKVVIFVLGSDPNNDAARQWAASKPNLLNVAVTRAKERLYIIGNKSKWEDEQYFKDAVKLLRLDSDQ